MQELEFNDPVPEYQKHLVAIRDLLPKDLLTLQETVSLHDAILIVLESDYNQKSLTILLNGDNGYGKLRQFTLRYSNVISFNSIVEPERGLQGPRGFGDLGYDEADMLPNGTFEHRLLFSSGIELQINFQDFKLDFMDYN